MLGRGLQDGVGARDAGVVDEDAGVAEYAADFGGDGGDGVRGGDVAIIVVDVCVWVKHQYVDRWATGWNTWQAHSFACSEGGPTHRAQRT